MERRLASIRRINRLDEIQGADNIDCATVDGWEVVVKKGEFEVGDLCVYFEVDSFLPNDKRYEFLKDIKTHQGKQGYRLKTIRLRKQISQGLALPLSLFPEIQNDYENAFELDDVTEILNVFKYDNSISGSVSAGKSTGSFPSFLRRTDEERIQNLSSWFERYKHIEWEETLKLDGSSCTMYKTNRNQNIIDKIKLFFGFKTNLAKFRVCSRNIELKQESNLSDFWKMAIRYKVEQYLPNGYAIQGELIGPRIQSNHENVDDLDFYIFNVYNIEQQRYLTPHERASFWMENLRHMKHVPVVGTVKIFDECTCVHSILERVKGKSMNKSTISEGRVYKSMDGTKSFKCINNEYLLKCEK